LLVLLTITLNGQSLYSTAFGDPKNKAVIFLHGGPGYNCAGFEATTAQNLSKEGYYVIDYDRRNEGRSTGMKAEFTFQEAFDDVNSLYKKYKIKSATLLGHSFGGAVGTLFAQKYTSKVNALVLIGAPVSLQETFCTIVHSAKEIYQQKHDSINLGYLASIEKMDTASLKYSSFCFMHAKQNNFYSPKQPCDEAKSIYALYKTDTLLMKYASQMTYPATMGFWKNEKYTTISLTTTLKELIAKKLMVYGLYGKEDGLYSKQQLSSLADILGNDRLRCYDNCSHNVFIDQQTAFLKALKDWIK
jgi:proline iminopeptidase